MPLVAGSSPAGPAVRPAAGELSHALGRRFESCRACGSPCCRGAVTLPLVAGSRSVRLGPPRLGAFGRSLQSVCELVE